MTPLTPASATPKSARAAIWPPPGSRKAPPTPSRILAEPLATFPVFAATPAGDPQWSAIVAWAIYALQRAELTASPWAAAGVDSLGVEGRELGLADDWLKRVVGAAGSYADIYARNLGDRSRLKLPRGPNAPAAAGGLFVTPYRE